MKPDTMRVRVTLEFDLPRVAEANPHPFLNQYAYDHTLQAAINWHSTQAMKWHCKEPEGAICKVHTNWSEWLSQASIEVERL